MELNALTAISPVDGRYRKTTEELSAYFSEYGLIKYRVLIEIEYFIALCDFNLPQLKPLDTNQKNTLRNVINGFSIEDALKIKETEKTTNHNLKTFEYFLKKKFTS